MGPIGGQGQYFSELECSLSSDMARMSHFCRQWRLAVPLNWEMQSARRTNYDHRRRRPTDVGRANYRPTAPTGPTYIPRPPYEQMTKAIAMRTAVPLDLYCYTDFDYTVIAVCCNVLYKTHLIAYGGY